MNHAIECLYNINYELTKVLNEAKEEVGLEETDRIVRNWFKDQEPKPEVVITDPPC